IEISTSDRAGNFASDFADFRIAAATLTLTLRAPGGEPIANADITVWDRLGPHELLSNADGKAELLIPPGELTIEAVSALNDPAQLGVYATARATDDNETVALELTLVPSGQADVLVLSRDGVTPKPGARVALLDSAGSVLRNVITDQSGHSLFKAVPVGSFRI